MKQVDTYHRPRAAHPTRSHACSSAGVYVLYNAAAVTQSDALADGATDIHEVLHPLHPLHDCESMLDMHGGLSWRSWGGFLFAFANGAVSGDGYTACLMSEIGGVWPLAWGYSFTFLLVTGRALNTRRINLEK